MRGDGENIASKRGIKHKWAIKTALSAVARAIWPVHNRYAKTKRIVSPCTKMFHSIYTRISIISFSSSFFYYFRFSFHIADYRKTYSRYANINVRLNIYFVPFSSLPSEGEEHDVRSKRCVEVGKYEVKSGITRKDALLNLGWARRRWTWKRFRVLWRN